MPRLETNVDAVKMDAIAGGCYIAAMSQAPANKPSGAYHHGDLRAQLLDVAARLLREEGEEGLSMRRLAQELGVSRTAPYHHFSDKHSLLCGIAEEGFRRFRQVNADAELWNVDTFSETSLQAFVRRYVNFAVSNAEYYDLMFGGKLWKSAALTASLKAEAYTAFREYVDHFRQLQAGGIFAANFDPLRYAQLSWSTLHGMSRLLIDGIYLDSSTVEEMCNTAAAMFWRQCRPLNTSG